MPLELFPYLVTDHALKNVVANAAKKWNKAMEGIAYFYPAIVEKPVVTIKFGPVDKTGQQDRIAQASYFAANHIAATPQTWVISLDNTIKWNTSTWWFNLQSGETAMGAVMHELGHTLGFGHSEVFSSVMHRSCGTTVISKEEAAWLRNNFIARTQR